ncbi:hypothetical protein ACLOJK_036551 [Asimina triloba]
MGDDVGAESGIEMMSPARILWIDLFRALEVSTGHIHRIIGWLGVGEHRVLFDDPLVEEVEFQIREPEPRSHVMMTQYEPRRIARESSLPLAPCRSSISAPRHRPSHVVRSVLALTAVLDSSKSERVHESPIDLPDSFEEAHLEGDGKATSDRSLSRGFDEASREAIPTVDVIEEEIFGGGGSMGVTFGISENAVAGHGSPIGEVSVTAGTAVVALISNSVSIVPVAQSQGSLGHIDIPLPTMSNLLFNEDGAGDLNVDNVDRPIGLPDVDELILSCSFFALARVERSPPSIHRAGFSRDRDSDNDFPTSSAFKSVDAVLRSAVEPIASGERIAIEAIVPDNDNGSGGNSSVGQHLPTCNADDHRNTVSEGLPQRDGSRESSTGITAPLDINTEFIEPFRELASSYFRRLMHTLSSFRDEFVKSLDDMDDPDDFDYLLNLCGNLKQSLRCFDTKLVGLPALTQLLTRFRDY